jgi:RNA polymerase sigma-70 factor, ECF subfamily
MDAFTKDQGVQWMLAYQQGSEESFDRLVEGYSGQVYALLTRFLGPVPEREDLVQEVFLRVIRARERYQATARFSTFLYRVAFNLAVNQTERDKGGQALERGGEEHPRAARFRGESHRELADPSAGHPSLSMEQRDVVTAVRAAIAELPETQRMALILAKYDELSYAEIAEVLHSSEKAIKSLVHRARENLRERLAPFLEQELA